MSKIRKIDSSSTPKPALTPAGPATAGLDYDKKKGLVINHDTSSSSSAAASFGPAFLVPDARQYMVQFDDFWGDSIDARWNFQEGSDTGADVTLNVQNGGVARIATAANATVTMAVNGIQFEGRLTWKPTNKNLSFEARVKLDAITTVAWFVGFTDQTSALEMPVTLSGSTFTTNASDAVGFLFDTAATTATWRMVGVKGDTDATMQTTGLAPVAATYETLRIEIDENGTATFFRNGVQVGVPMINACTPGTFLVPVFAGFARAASVRNLDVDYVAVGQSRV